MAVRQVYALDLGSTRFKLGRLGEDGRLTDVRAEQAPGLSGDELIREGDPDQFLSAANALLASIPDPENADIGLVSQRSTFTVWDRRSGQALVPMISWQDRRADEWCSLNDSVEDTVKRITGLPLSAHYVGPKLAAMTAADKRFAAQLADENTLVGTLDSWLIWNWVRGEQHLTDLTMAARTALIDLKQRHWSEQACDLFGVPRSALPDVRSTGGWNMQLESGLTLQANIADQAAGMRAVLAPGEDAALINFGTGAFVLRPTGSSIAIRSGYISGPTLGSDDAADFAVEGTINGAGPALDKFGAGPTDWPDESDPSPDAFAIPDLSGLGSPHWRADISLRFSAGAGDLATGDKRRVVLEGLLFRVYEILSDLGNDKISGRVVISGGLTRDPGVATGLASLLGEPVDVLLEPEATLLGTARLAAGLDPYANPRVRTVQPHDSAAYLSAKYLRWRAWLDDLLMR